MVELESLGGYRGFIENFLNIYHFFQLQQDLSNSNAIYPSTKWYFPLKTFKLAVRIRTTRVPFDVSLGNQVKLVADVEIGL